MNNEFNLQDYLANGVEIIIKDALRASIKNPKEILFLRRFSKHTRKANEIRQKYDENGQNIPAFLIASITSSCNLHCTGCYSRANKACSDDAPLNQLSGDEWGDIFNEAKDLGISFIVLAGGEPMIREDVIRSYPEQQQRSRRCRSQPGSADAGGSHPAVQSPSQPEPCPGSSRHGQSEQQADRQSPA